MNFLYTHVVLRVCVCSSAFAAFFVLFFSFFSLFFFLVFFFFFYFCITFRNLITVDVNEQRVAAVVQPTENKRIDQHIS